MSMGIEYGPAKMNASKSLGYTAMIESATSATFTESGSTTITVDCGSASGETVGLWQWVTKTNDGIAISKTALTICRFVEEAMFNTKPECPYPACADSMCTTCHDW